MRALWGMDGSESARAVGEQLCAVLPSTAELVALAVVPADPLPWLEAPILGVGHAIDEERRTELTAALQAGVAATGWPAGQTRVRVESGDVARVITAVARAEEAEILGLGARAQPYAEELIGPICREVLIQAPCPVLVGRISGPWEQVLLATDGSAPARAAEDFLLGLELGNAVVHVRCVADEKVPAGARPAGLSPLAEESMVAEIAEEAAGRVAAAGHPVTRHVRAGRPAATLVEMARDVHADVIVLGTHGLTGWRRAVLGSVAGEVARTSSTSVLVVPPPSGAP